MCMLSSNPSTNQYNRTMVNIAEGVDFDTIAREWRCKWSPDNEKKSLVETQKALGEILEELKAVDGVKKVDRVVCGGCMDFKVSYIIKTTVANSCNRVFV